MKIFWNPALILGLFVWIPAVTYSYSSQAPEDQDTSGDDYDDESSGSGMAVYVPPLRFFDPVMPKVQTTKVPVTNASHSTLPTTIISSGDVVVIEKETTTVSLVDPETTTILIEKGFVPVVAEDYTTKAFVKEDNRPTVSVQVIDKKTTVPHMETAPVQTTTISSVDVVVIEKETTTVSLVDPETTTILIEKGFVPVVAEDYTTKAVVKEDNKPTVSVKVIDKKTTVPHMETVPVQTTKKSVVVTHPEPKATAKTTTVLMTTASRNYNPIFEDPVITEDINTSLDSEKDSDFVIDKETIKTRKGVNEHGAMGASSGNDSFLERKEVLACVIAGGVVGLLFSVMLVGLMVYRMKKKDEGSYALQDMPQPYVYQKAQKQEEFFA